MLKSEKICTTSVNIIEDLIQDSHNMDAAKLNLLRIPLATILFLSSVFLLSTYFSEMDGVLSAAGAFLCIATLVYSMVLFSNLDLPVNRF